MIGDLRMLWDYYWPAIAAVFVIGVVLGLIGFRNDRTAGFRNRMILAGVAVSIAAAALWHGPLGAADRFQSRLGDLATRTLAYYEMTTVTARLDGEPLLNRQFRLSGSADDFQRSELARMFASIPGASGAYWADRSQPPARLPLIVEAVLLALAGFGLALMLAYLLELRRRERADWRW